MSEYLKKIHVEVPNKAILTKIIQQAKVTEEAKLFARKETVLNKWGIIDLLDVLKEVALRTH